MAELKITDKHLTVHLAWWEKMGARRSHLTVPRRAIRAVRVVDNVIASVDTPARRSTRMRIPGLFVLGTRNPRHHNDPGCDSEFSACRKNTPGLVIEFENISIDRIVISTRNAQRYALELERVS